jgi:hypothetical protein
MGNTPTKSELMAKSKVMQKSLEDLLADMECKNRIIANKMDEIEQIKAECFIDSKSDIKSVMIVIYDGKNNGNNNIHDKNEDEDE